MEKGHLRCDANVSVRPRGQKELGTKVEVKNLNSFRFLKQAIDYEIERQVGVIESGGRIHQETRLFNSDTGVTAGMRSKEQAHDYRYFPEPDLAPLRVAAAWLAEVRSTMPELPAARRARFVSAHGLREYDAAVLTATRMLADYYEKAAEVSKYPRITANWVTQDLAGLLKAAGTEIDSSPVPPDHLGELVGMVVRGELTGKLGKDVLAKMFATGEPPGAIVEREGLKTIADTGALEKIVDEALAANPKQVEQYRAGKTTLIGFLVGQAMKASRGQANPAALNELLKSRLG
jgi:aspartyl-tRNA(Asn)/glutamyl-tRNA(Gln) amidotransferase subunit B